MRKRILRILLFPAVVIIFLIGWALYFIGDRAESKKEPKGIEDGVQEVETIADNDNVEVGLIEEALEKQLD
jgi:hypothetical protein